jgi:hypothetical protein
MKRALAFALLMAGSPLDAGETISPSSITGRRTCCI